MQLLLIKINGLASVPEYALLGKKQAEDRFVPSDWTKVRSLTRGRKVVLLIPNTDVVLTSTKIPSKNKKQLLQAVPFSLEDSLAEDIEDLHFAVHQEKSDDLAHVAIISKNRLDRYIDFLRKQGITTHFVLPQILVQTLPEKGWSVLKTDNSVDVRLDSYNGFSCDENLLELFLTEQVEENSAPESIFSNLERNELPESLQDSNLVKSDTRLVRYTNTESALALNLITGFISHKKESNINWKAWRPTLILGSLVAAIGLSILGWQNNILKTESELLNQAIEKTYKSTFPNSRLVDPPQQMTSKLAQLQASAGKTAESPLPLIADISPLIIEFKDLTLSEVRYQEDVLELVMSSPNVTRLERFKKDAATKAKLDVIIKSSTTTPDKVEAILVISPLPLSAADTKQQDKHSLQQEKAS